MPQFPNFSKVNLASSIVINDFTSRFEPYSDFNFISLWSWDTSGEHEYSILHDNLVIKLSDYVTNEATFSVLGTGQADRTAYELLSYAKTVVVEPCLKVVPEVFAERLSHNFEVKEDPDSFDYIYSTAAIAAYQGNEYKNKRQLRSKFEQTYPEAEMIHESASSPEAQVKVFDLLHRWAKEKIENGKAIDLKNEQSAILRSLKAADNDLKIFLTTLRLGDEIIAFSIDEIVSEEYAISHFFKTDHSHTGCTEYFNSAMASHLRATGIKYWNWEQDLGIPGLKDTKQRYRPVHYLKKFTIRLKD